MKKAVVIFLGTALLFLAGWAGFRLAGSIGVMQEKGAAPQGVAVITEGNVGQAALQDIQRTVSHFDEILQAEMGVQLTEPVTLFVAAGTADYEHVLAREFSLSPEEASEVAVISGGWSSGGNHITAVNGAAGVMGNSADRMGTAAHELFHQMQYELSSGRDTDAQALFWLEEGSADYVGALVAERLGGRKLEKWRRDTLCELRASPQTIAPRELMYCDMERRKEIMEKKYHSYQMSDQMVLYLLSLQQPGTELRQLAAYFRTLGEGLSGNEAFRQTFGIDVEPFLAGFSQWHRQQINRTAKMSLQAEDGISVSTATGMAEQFEKAQELFRHLWGRELKGEYQVILTADGKDMARALVKECSIAEDKAAGLAGESLWVENGSTVVVNAGQLDGERQIVFSSAVMMTRSLQEQLMGASSDELEWMRRGMAYLVGIRRMSESGMGRLDQYRRTWLEHCRGKEGPMLAQMMTSQDYLKTSADGRAEQVTELSELAVLILVERKGWESLREWMMLTREKGSMRQAFSQVYGMSAEEYSRQFWKLLQ